MAPLRTFIVLATILGAATLGAAQPDKQRKPKFTIGKETTVVDGPLDKQGYVDYVTALNLRLGKGVRPDTNMVAVMAKVFGPKADGSEAPPEFYQWLGIPALPEKGDYYISLYHYVRENLKGGQAELNEVYERWDRAIGQPWKAKQHVQLAGWLQLNEKPLAAALAATKCPRYYLPILPDKGKRDVVGLRDPRLISVQRYRELAATLPTRAMLHLGEGRIDEAWEDLLACHRLARPCAQGGTLLEVLVGAAIDAIASHAELNFLGSTKLDAKKLKSCLRDLQALQPMPAVADRIDVGERFIFLDTIMLLDRFGSKDLEPFGIRLSDASEKGLRAKLDWDPVLKNVNRWFDRVTKILRVDDRAKREKLLDEVDDDLKKLKKEISDPDLPKKLADDKTTAEERGKLVSDVLVSLMLPAVRKVQEATDRSRQKERNLCVAFALAAYKSDEGAYPRTLAALAPKYLDKIPGDLFTGKALTYRRTEDGYLLYSFGPNGKDDGGRYYDDDPPGDDPSVRMPLPVLKRK